MLTMAEREMQGQHMCTVHVPGLCPEGSPSLCPVNTARFASQDESKVRDDELFMYR